MTFLEFLKLEGNNTNFEEALAYNKSLSKRILDILLAVIGLIFLSPLFFIISIVIILDSPGKAFYKQKRVGKQGKLFDIYKFRTMCQDVDDTLHQQHIQSYVQGTLDGTNGYKFIDDPRITKIGRILRKTSLDELPQLINVIRGEMSLVGPRPVPIYEADLHNLWQNERMEVLPGITGLWQVLGRSSVSLQQQIRLDIHYIRNQSLWFDIKIIIATIIAAINTKGAG